MKISVHLIVSMSLFLGTGCMILATDMDPSTPEPKECTLIGCDDTLTVQIYGYIPKTYMVVLIDPDGDEVEFQCGQEELTLQPNYYYDPKCESWGFWLSNYSPNIVEITMEWDGEIFSKTVRPSHNYSYPNGPDCPPECRSGRASIYIPNP